MTCPESDEEPNHLNYNIDENTLWGVGAYDAIAKHGGIYTKHGEGE